MIIDAIKDLVESVSRPRRMGAPVWYFPVPTAGGGRRTSIAYPVPAGQVTLAAAPATSGHGRPVMPWRMVAVSAGLVLSTLGCGGDLGLEEEGGGAFGSQEKSGTAAQHVPSPFPGKGRGLSHQFGDGGVPVTAPVGLVAQWKFDEDVGTLLVDSSGNGHHGQRLGGAGLVSYGTGLAGSFDGADDLAEVPDAPALHFTTALTATAWVNPGSTAGIRTIVNKWYAMDSYGLFIENGLAHFSVAFPDGGWGTSVRVSAPITANTWTHVAGVFDGATVMLYLDGVAVAQAPAPGTLQDSSRPIAIGNHPGWNAYLGAIDDVRLYRAALTAAEVASLAR